MACEDELRLVDRVVISDDGSSDDTVKLAVHCWTSATPLEILTSPSNFGEYINVNSAVMGLGSETKWYLLMHSDNLAKRGWIRTLVTEARSAPDSVGSVCTSYDFRKLNGEIILGENGTERIRMIPASKGSINDTLQNGCWWHNSTAAVRVAAFRDIGGMPAEQGLSQMGDWDFSLRLLANGWDIAYVPKALIIYCDNTFSVSSTNFITHRDVLDRAKVTENFCDGAPVDLLNRCYSQMYRTLFRRLASSLVRGHGRRFFAAIVALGKVMRSHLYCLKHRSETREPRRFPVRFEKKTVLRPRALSPRRTHQI